MISIWLSVVDCSINGCIVLNIIAPAFKQRQVVSPVGALDWANTFSEDVLNLILELLSWPKVQIAVKNNRNYLANYWRH